MSMKAAIGREVPEVISQCHKCDGSTYRLGHYDEHVRESMHDGHEADRSFMVDLEGKIHRNVRSGS